MSWLIELLKSSPLLLLVLVVSIGFALGQIRIAGVQLGVAMVLFVGIGIGSLDPNLKLPDLVYFLGLSLFVYTVGLSSAPSFFRALNRQGLRQSGLVIGSLTVSFVLTWFLAKQLGIKGGVASALYSGALTNAPSLASALDSLRSSGASEAQLAPVVAGYAVAYPPGILIPLLLIPLFRAITGVNLKEEAKTIPAYRLMSEKIEAFTIRVTKDAIVGTPVKEIAADLGNAFTFGRRRRGDHDEVVDSRTTFEIGDLVSVIGSESQALRVAEALGEMTEIHLEHDRHQLDFRRVIVSNAKVAGRSLGELRLSEEFGAVITRVKRGDF